MTVATTETQPQQPTVAELEEAMTHLAATCNRYGRYDHRYAEWHQELNHLLDDRENLLLTQGPEVL